MNQPAPAIGQCYFFHPSGSFDDFPVSGTDRIAENLLITWTAAWHPAILAATQSVPALLSDPWEPEPGSLVFVPQLYDCELEQSREQVTAIDSITILQSSLYPSRSELVQVALSGLAGTAEQNRSLSPVLVDDFFALGYAYLQVLIMTRQLRYSSNLPLEKFALPLQQAAQASQAGDEEETRKWLAACFDLLLEERNSYYPIRPQLIDLVLLADSTLTQSLDRQLAADHALSLLMTGQLANQLASRNPAAITRIVDLLDERKLSFIGGLQNETPDPLLSVETTLRQLATAQLTLEQHFKTGARVFGRRSFGFTSSLPAFLEQHDFIGAMHVNFDEGQIPAGSSTNIRWTGIDGSYIQAHCGSVLDAAQASALLGLGKMLGRQMDSTHTAVAVFAHWPHQYSPTFPDLLNIQKYAPVLGHFVQAEDYFDSLYDPGYGDRFEMDEYRSPYLRQAIELSQTNPISIYVDYWQAQSLLVSCRAMLTFFALQDHWRGATKGSELAGSPRQWTEDLQQIEALEEKLDKSVADRDATLTQQVLHQVQTLLNSLSQDYLPASIGEPRSTVDNSSAKPEKAAKSWLALNTLNFRRRVISSRPLLSRPQKSTRPIVYADQQTDNYLQVLELDALSSAPITDSMPTSVDPLASEPSMLDGLSLKNEFFELQIDPQTGGIKTFASYQNRQNLLSQQLAIRIPESKQPTAQSRGATSARYTTMLVDQIETLSKTRLSASIVSRGRLCDGDQVLAEYRQSVTVTRGIPTAELEIELLRPATCTAADWSPLQFQDPYHYLCNRLAWHDESGELSANFQDIHHRFGAEWVHATQFLQVEQGGQKVTLLTGGLPFHRRVSRKMLDSLLLVGTESRRCFRLGIGLNLPYPMLSAASRLTPPILLPMDTAPHSSNLPAPWCFHFDRKNILVTWWQPEFDSESRLVGVQLRCQETEGRSGELTITCPQPITSAALMRVNGNFQRSLRQTPATPNLVTQHFNAYEIFQIQIHL